MPALLEAPAPRTKRPAPRTAWNKEQAKEAFVKSLATRRRKSQERKEAKLKLATLPDLPNEPDPYTHLSKSLERAARQNKGKLAVNLATALAKLKSAGAKPSASYTPTSSSVPRQPTPSTPQVTQAHAPQGNASEANFAQCREHLVGPAKESLSCGTVGAGPGVGGAVGAGGGGVIEHITRTAYSGVDASVKPGQVYASPQEEIAALEARLAVLKAQVRQVQVHPTAKPEQSLVGVAPVQAAEKFCVNGVWIAGVRKR